MKNKYLPSLNNSKGAALMAMVMLIGVMLLVMFGVAVSQLTAVSKESYRINEAYRFLNIMEEMGQAVSKAKVLGSRVDSGALGACPAGTTSFSITGNTFCFIGTFTGINNFCIHHSDTYAQGGTGDDYCIQNLTVGAKENASDSMYADVTFDIGPVRKPSLIARAINFIGLNKSYAACSDDYPWHEQWRCGSADPQPTAPVGPFSPALPDLSSVPPSPPPPATPTPGGAGDQKTDGTTALPRANMEPWKPTSTVWTHNNEIRTPMCLVDSDDWLGCVRCANPNVTCIMIRMCPPSNPSCSTPYAQRIAVY